MPEKTPVEMFNELIALGYIMPADTDPSDFGSAYFTPITTLAFETPPVPVWNPEKEGPHAELPIGRLTCS